MSRFATGVTVVTATDSSLAAHGITVSSFNSVSLEPPLVLFSIGKQSARFEVFGKCKKFIVNILGDKQKSVSRHFARTSKGSWGKCLLVDGIPVIRDAIAYFYCDTHKVYDGGDHNIIVGKVSDCMVLSDDDPLLYYRSKYCVLDGSL